MKFDLYPKGKPFNMALDLVITRPVKLLITVFDSETKRVYSERKVGLSRRTNVFFKLPIVPQELTVKIKQLSRIATKAFKLNEIKIKPDTKCPVELTERDKKFIRFAKWFSTNVTNLEAGQRGTLYQSEGFTLLLIDKLIADGKELTTPARIARDSGVIEISKNAVKDYTVPMLIVMLLHEYSHKWKNPEYGRKVSNELSADLIAVHIALNLGFDSREVLKCFKSVFAKKDTELNRKRLSAIQDFIKIFKGSEKKRCKVK